MTDSVSPSEQSNSAEDWRTRRARQQAATSEEFDRQNGLSIPKTVPIEEVLGEDWQLPDGFHWEYRDGEDGGGSQSVGLDGTRHSEIILPTRYRRAVGPWEVIRERTRI